MGEWQDISTAPRDGTALLAFRKISNGEGMWVVVWWDADRGAWRFTSRDVLHNSLEPTHWMPVPEPPAQGDIPEGGR